MADKNIDIEKIKNTFTDLLFHPDLNKAAQVCSDVLDVAYKLNQAKNSPLLAAAAAGSTLASLQKRFGSSKDLVERSIVSLGLQGVTGQLGVILIETGLVDLFEPKKVCQEDSYKLLKLTVDKSKKLYVYLYVYEKYIGETTMYLPPGVGKDINKKIIFKCFKHLKTNSVDLYCFNDGRSVGMRASFPVFNEHPVEKVLEFANNIHFYRKKNVSIAYVFYGRPGTGKTTMALSVAEMINARSMVLGPEVISTINPDMLLDMAIGIDPDIIILDDIDKSSNRPMFYRTLNQIRDQNKNLVIVATTNDLEKLGSAFLRPGRGGEIVYFFPPTREEKIDIINKIDPRFTEKVIDFIDEKATHDWITHVGEKLLSCKDEKEAIFATKDSMMKFKIIEKIDAIKNTKTFDDYLSFIDSSKDNTDFDLDFGSEEE